MIKINDGDLFDTKAKFIAHQVNCQSRMGSGIALQVKRKYPHVFEEYIKICSSDMLGKVQFVPVKPQYIGYDPGSILISHHEQWICNLFAQDNYGYDGKQYTSVEALSKCFKILQNRIFEKNNNFGATIAMPYQIGCVRGGADWDEVYALIEETFINCKVELWRLDKG